MMYSQEILGGVLIGLASALPLLYEGRIAGISGYASSAMRPNSNDNINALFLVIGLALGGLIWKLMGGALPSTDTHKALWLWALAGFLVGYGSRLGGGCTSGHGVCGLGRASPRSLASVLTFMGTAILVVVAQRILS
jgi:uncharacterized membrane protein YedE/YeeE